MSVLIVDDERPNVDLFVRVFDEDFAILTASSGAEALTVLETNAIAVIVSDHRMPGMTGVDLLAEAGTRWPDVRRVLLTAYSDRGLLLDAIRRGHVHEYVVKPWDADDLRLRIQGGIAAFDRAKELAGAERERTILREELDRRIGGSAIIGLEGGLKGLHAALAKLGASDAPVVLRGETGTGKDTFARAIHRDSPRNRGPFVRVACRVAALDLEKKAAQAEGGTLFLDEVAALPGAAQETLLELVDARTCRIIAATRDPLEDAVKAGSFREDLFFRLVVVPLRIPPLRDRGEDIGDLARHFARSIGAQMGKTLQLGDEATALLSRYDWPGNVRELRNVVERACILAEPNATLEREDLLLDFAAPPPPSPAAGASIFDEISADEATRVRDALKAAAGNRARAARSLGIPRTTLNDRMKRLGIV